MEGSGDFLMKWALKEFGGAPDPIDAYDSYMQEVSKRGSTLHRYMECDLLGIPFDGEVTKDILPGVESWHQFRSKHTIEVLESEKILWSKKFRFAGQMDLLINLDGTTYVADLKTGSVMNKAFTQLAAYKYMAMEMGVKGVEKAKLLVLGGGSSKTKIADGGKILLHTMEERFKGLVSEEDLFASFMCLRYLWYMENLRSNKFEAVIKGMETALDPMVERFKKSFDPSASHTKKIKGEKIK